MYNKTVFYRRNLPHFHPEGGMFFITFRLARSLPKHVLIDLVAKRQERISEINQKLDADSFYEEKYKIEKRFFAAYDKWLDQCQYGPDWLATPEIAKIVFHKILKMDKKQFDVIAFTIMSNHVHMIVDFSKYKNAPANNGKMMKSALSNALKLLKGATSRKCNAALFRKGQFWHHESYDHLVRDNDELVRIIEYILQNPVKAGSVEDFNDYQFSYLSQSFSL